MQWVSSQGGPLILVPQDLVQDWGGNSQPAIDREVARPRKADVPSTDYYRACSIRDYIELIDIGIGYGLVFGDEPLQTGWLLSAGKGEGVFARWRYADSEASVTQHLASIPDYIFQPTGVVFQVCRSKLFLFDAAIPGRSLRDGDYLLIELRPGEYRIQTGLYEPDAQTALVLHRLLR